MTKNYNIAQGSDSGSVVVVIIGTLVVTLLLVWWLMSSDNGAMITVDESGEVTAAG